MLTATQPGPRGHQLGAGLQGGLGTLKMSLSPAWPQSPQPTPSHSQPCPHTPWHVEMLLFGKAEFLKTIFSAKASVFPFRSSLRSGMRHRKELPKQSQDSAAAEELGADVITDVENLHFVLIQNKLLPTFVQQLNGNLLACAAGPCTVVAFLLWAMWR